VNLQVQQKKIAYWQIIFIIVSREEYEKWLWAALEAQLKTQEYKRIYLGRNTSQVVSVAVF
jgi:hypothetical protein